MVESDKEDRKKKKAKTVTIGKWYEALGLITILQQKGTRNNSRCHSMQMLESILFQRNHKSY